VSGAFIPAPLRLANWQRGGGRCEYCLLHEEDAIVPHQPDHIVAVQHGGQSVADNLALACCDCNLLKGTNLASVDPETGQPAFLFHPRRDRWADHFRLEGGRIVGLTASGRATMFLLQFNTPDRIRLRQQLERAGRYPPPV
jgi:hypothetical protein